MDAETIKRWLEQRQAVCDLCNQAKAVTILEATDGFPFLLVADNTAVCEACLADLTNAPGAPDD